MKISKRRCDYGNCPCGGRRNYKLHLFDVREIRRRWKRRRRTGERCVDIAMDFNIHPSHVSNIGVRRFWRDY